MRHQIQLSPEGYVLFDDTVLTKEHSHKIELVRRQYSGNPHGIIKGIGVVKCVYFNPATSQFWLLDYQIFNPDEAGKTKTRFRKTQNSIFENGDRIKDSAPGKKITCFERKQVIRCKYEE